MMHMSLQGMGNVIMAMSNPLDNKEQALLLGFSFLLLYMKIYSYVVMHNIFLQFF